MKWKLRVKHAKIEFQCLRKLLITVMRERVINFWPNCHNPMRIDVQMTLLYKSLQ